jgi:hypothetical protein
MNELQQIDGKYRYVVETIPGKMITEINFTAHTRLKYLKLEKLRLLTRVHLNSQ